MKYVYPVLLIVLLLVSCSPTNATLPNKDILVDDTHTRMHDMHAHADHVVASEEAFLREMIPHHQEAVVTSQLMLSSSNPGVASLALAIYNAQFGEIDQMNEWLSLWYEESDYVVQYKDMMPFLGDVDSVERDIAYLTGMIEHHEGAIMMAVSAQSTTLHPEVYELTQVIIEAQQGEIVFMRSLLDELQKE